jgi:hypothetical protein
MPRTRFIEELKLARHENLDLEEVFKNESSYNEN